MGEKCVQHPALSIFSVLLFGNSLGKLIFRAMSLNLLSLSPHKGYLCILEIRWLYEEYSN